MKISTISISIPCPKYITDKAKLVKSRSQKTLSTMATQYGKVSNVIKATKSAIKKNYKKK